MEVNREKIVNFDEYCDKCEFKDLLESEDPCFDCLTESTNEYTHRPVHFKEKESK